jgi:hypothetical protein
MVAYSGDERAEKKAELSAVLMVVCLVESKALMRVGKKASLMAASMVVL